MLLLPLLIAVSAGAHTQAFNITYFSVPAVVGPEEDFAELECHYQTDGFTTIGFWREDREFFRFQPMASPSIRVFDLCGADSVEMINCGLKSCKIKIGGMSPNASGEYKCDLVKEVPPHRNIRKMAYMVIQRDEPIQPKVDGLPEEYRNGETLGAVCRPEFQRSVRWYINGHEHIEFRNMTYIQKPAYPSLRKSLPRTLEVQCAVYKYGRLYFSEPRTARWCEDTKYRLEEAPSKGQEQIRALHKDVIKIKAPHTDIVEMKASQKQIIEVVDGNEVTLVVLCNNGSPIITGFLGSLSTLLKYLLAKLVVI